MTQAALKRALHAAHVAMRRKSDIERGKRCVVSSKRHWSACCRSHWRERRKPASRGSRSTRAPSPLVARRSAASDSTRLRGVVFGEVDPNDPLNEVITDIKIAPRNARGMVEYNVDFWLNKPVDMSKANGTLLHDVPNRGNVRSVELNVGGSGDSGVGDGFVQRQGYVLSDNGWEGDVATGLQVRIPVARNRNGTEIVNRIRAE